MKKSVPYSEAFGTYVLPEGFAETLKGKSVEQQMDRYRVSGSTTCGNTGWQERTCSPWYLKLGEASDVLALIVDNDLLVGIMVKDDNGREVPCFADERVCTYYAEDNNGAGCKTRTEYICLICVAEDFKD